MNAKIVYTGLITCILLILVAGHLHWNKKIEVNTMVLANANENLVPSYTRQNDLKRKQLNEDISALKKVLNDYELKFIEVLTEYQEEMNHLLLEAEQEYYTKILPKQKDFREFVLDYSDQSEIVKNTSETHYLNIYESFSEALVSLGYSENEGYIYYLFFEEITVERQTTFITELIFLQTP